MPAKFQLFLKVIICYFGRFVFGAVKDYCKATFEKIESSLWQVLSKLNKQFSTKPNLSIICGGMGSV